jgi:hypothetical protein
VLLYLVQKGGGWLASEGDSAAAVKGVEFKGTKLIFEIKNLCYAFKHY